ncbi:MAG: PAS domain S-box protein [Acidobacteriota bacterium]
MAVAVALGCAGGAWASYTLAFAEGLVAFWIPSGLLLGALLVADRRQWPAILAGGYLGNVAIDFVFVGPVPLRFLAPVANVLEAVVAAAFVRRLCEPALLISSLRGIAALLLGAGVVSNALTAVAGAAVLTAIAERERAGARARASEERYRALVDAVGDGIITIDRRGVVRFANPAAERMLGYEPGTLPGREASTVLNASPAAWLDPQVGGGDPAPDAHLTAVHRDGHAIPVELAFGAWAADGERFVTAVVRDISDRLNAGQQRERLRNQLVQAQKMESIGRLAGGIAHDFNNMLTVILGHAEMGREKAEPGAPALRHLHEIHRAASRSANLTQQLLGFARQQTVAPRRLDLNETVRGMLSMLRRLIGEDIDLAWKPGASLWAVRVDPSQIDQILVNLCANARDAIDGVGRVTVETANVVLDEVYCAAHAGFVPGEYVLLAVSDDGHGMDADTLAHAFEPFFTTKELGKGTGLGLATTYGIVKQNQGFINVYSEVGEGATVKIYLPREPVAAAPPPADDVVRPMPRGVETVLLVEDEPAILELTGGVLTGLGYTALAAGSPADALRLAEQHDGAIHLLLTDVIMPGMNGRELATLLSARYPNLKCLFMSGYTANVIAHRGVLDPGVHFLQKPYTPKDLAAKLREALES